MFNFKPLFPAIIATGASFLTGCFDPGNATDPASNQSSTLATQASVASTGIWEWLAYPGRIVAFASGTSLYGWALDTNYTPKPIGGFALRRFSGGSSAIVPVGLVDLDIVNTHEIWGVNESGKVRRNSTADAAGGGTWVDYPVPASARSIATGSGGSVYMLSKELSPTGGGYKLYKYSGSGTGSSDWANIPAGLVDIDVDNNGDLWGINSGGDVFLLVGGHASGTWQLMSSSDGFKIAAGGGNIYILSGSLTANGGQVVEKWNGSNFVTIPGGLLDIQADDSGRLWGANNESKIFRYTP
jgi:hypothetical protein